MADKDLSEAIDDFFDVRSLAAVLLGFVLAKWVEVLVLMWFGTSLTSQAIIWPIIFIVLLIVLANASKKTNGELKAQEFRDKVANIIDEMRDE